MDSLGKRAIYAMITRLSGWSGLDASAFFRGTEYLGAI
jgi:hypothetical protein